MDDIALTKLINLGVKKFTHINGSLLEHLKGTRELLLKWGSREALCNAGLYHSVYGTQGFKNQTTTDRDDIVSVIGEEAEKIVYYFSTCDRDYFYPQFDTMSSMTVSAMVLEVKHRNHLTGEIEILDELMVRDLLELTLANELEILIKLPFSLPKKWRILFVNFKNYISEAAYQEFENSCKT